MELKRYWVTLKESAKCAFVIEAKDREEAIAIAERAGDDNGLYHAIDNLLMHDRGCWNVEVSEQPTDAAPDVTYKDTETLRKEMLISQLANQLKSLPMFNGKDYYEISAAVRTMIEKLEF